MQGAKWERVSLSGSEELKAIFPKIRMEGIAQRVQDQENTGVLPPLGIDPVVLRKVADYMFAFNSNIRTIVSRENNREAPKVMSLLGLLVRATEIARKLPAAARKRTIADMGVEAPFTGAVAHATEAFDTTAACAYVKRDGSDEQSRLRERQRAVQEIEAETLIGGKRTFSDMEAAGEAQQLQAGLDLQGGKEESMANQLSTHGSSPLKKASKVVQGLGDKNTLSRGPVQGAAAAQAMAAAEAKHSETTVLSGRLTYQLANSDAQFDHLKRVWVENQSLYGSGQYFTNVFSELQFDLEVEIQGRKLKLRRNAWEGKANLRQEYKKKVNQAGKTGVCIYLHNLAQGVEVERVHVPLGDDEEFVLVQFVPERGTWHLGDHPGDLRGDIYISERVEVARTDPQNPDQVFEAGADFLTGAAYIIKAYLGEALSGLTPSEMDAILVEVEVDKALSSVKPFKQAYRDDAKWFNKTLRSYERGPNQQVPAAALQEGVSTRATLLEAEAGVPSYKDIYVPAPERPPAMDSTTYQWKRLNEEAERMEAVAKVLRRHAEALNKQRRDEILSKQKQLAAALAEIDDQH